MLSTLSMWWWNWDSEYVFGPVWRINSPHCLLKTRIGKEAHVPMVSLNISIWLWLTWQLVDKGVSVTGSLGPPVLIFNCPAIRLGLIGPWGPVAVNQKLLIWTKFKSLTPKGNLSVIQEWKHAYWLKRQDGHCSKNSWYSLLYFRKVSYFI